ncbi:MAG: hypothetical protein H8E44_04330 [Planctomycetes bacterium]|nr:hypothetical protein [Planctomycetota bacterium]
MARYKKTAACPNCCPDGKSDFEAVDSSPTEIILDFVSDYDGREYTKLQDIPVDEPQPCWECTNCGMRLKRRIQERPTEHSPLTSSQLYAITAIQQYKIRDDENREIKSLRIENHGSFVSVAITVGMPNDRGTMAALYCRDRGHFFVGRRGKIRAMNGKATKAQKAKYPLIYGWES